MRTGLVALVLCAPVQGRNQARPAPGLRAMSSPIPKVVGAGGPRPPLSIRMLPGPDPGPCPKDELSLVLPLRTDRGGLRPNLVSGKHGRGCLTGCDTRSVASARTNGAKQPAKIKPRGGGRRLSARTVILLSFRANRATTGILPRHLPLGAESERTTSAGGPPGAASVLM